MPRPIRTRLAVRPATALAITALLTVLLPAAAQGSERPGQGDPERWTRTLAVDLSAPELGLPAGASARRLARAALERNAKRLGLKGSSLRLDSRVHTPAADGGRALDQLRFQQRAGSLRVVWSQIDVTVLARRVSTISATVVPLEGGPAAGERRVSRKRALGIALRAVPGATEALDPLAGAYAGSPSAERKARARTARRAWVVEVEPAPEPGSETPTPLCIVVDAESGEVIGRWPGIADRPESGPRARGADRGSLSALRDARENPGTLLTVRDPSSALYAEFVTTGDARDGASWPTYEEARRRTETDEMDAISANVANVARTICVVRGYCGATGGFQQNAVAINPWNVTGNVDDISKAFAADLHVQMAASATMEGDGDPNLPANDLVAHEFGHVMDWVYAGDRLAGAPTVVEEPDEVEEALADMFAYDYDRADATLGEEAGPPLHDWADPGPSQPAHMDDYDEARPSAHHNSTILSHAYYLFVQRVGHNRAGRVLHNVPSLLSPRPSFPEVARRFYLRAVSIYGGDVGAAALEAFGQVGLNGRPCKPCDFPGR